MDEFTLIDTCFRRATTRADLLLGIGDDCALVQPPPGQELALTIDTLVAGVHFPAGLQAEDIGYRALAVNLSDLAAMGATPAFATLSLCLPGADEAWVQSFANGFFELADQHAVALVGGDTVRGAQLTATVQLTGYIPAGQALRRSGARVGDAIAVSGPLGLAALALQAGDGAPPLADQKLRRPTPRVQLGEQLRGLAHACIDISDGLCADLGHILTASDCGARLEEAALPLAGDERGPRLVEFALTGGDDYELCFTLDPARAGEASERALAVGAQCHVIGAIEPASGLRITRGDGTCETLSQDGYRHF